MNQIWLIRSVLLLIYLFSMVSSEYIMATASLNVVENDFIKIVVGPEGFDHGRFSIETTGGDPSRDSDDNVPLIYGRPKPWTSFTTFSVDDVYYGFGTQTIKRAGKGIRYGQVTNTDVSETGIKINTKIDSLIAEQTLELFRNPLTNVKDSVLIEYKLSNMSEVSKNIGVRIMMDTMLGKNDASPFRIGNDSVIAETSYTKDAILDYWQTFDSLVSPNIIGQGILRYLPAGITPPDELILMNWGSLSDMPYKVTVVEGRSFIRSGEDEPDTALALLWNPTLLGPGKTISYRTVMGLGGVTLEPGDLALGLTAPSIFAITDPNEYLVIAYMLNTGGFLIKDVQVQLTLPKGLELVDGNSVLDLGDILPDGSRQLVYKVKVSPKEVAKGEQFIQLDVKSSTLSDQSVQRKINFSGQPNISFMPVGPSYIKRGVNQFVDIAIKVTNESEIVVSKLKVSLNQTEDSPFLLPKFETPNREIPVLKPGQSKELVWKLKVDEWLKGVHQVPFSLESIYTKAKELNVPVEIDLGVPKAKLFYSDSNILVNDYGYVWIVLFDMPTFSGLDLNLTWDDNLKPIRVSPEPWLVEQDSNIIDSFVITNNIMQINDISAINPNWRLILGKFHFKAQGAGGSEIILYQGDEPLDSINLILKKSEGVN